MTMVFVGQIMLGLAALAHCVWRWLGLLEVSLQYPFLEMCQGTFKIFKSEDYRVAFHTLHDASRGVIPCGIQHLLTEMRSCGRVSQ